MDTPTAILWCGALLFCVGITISALLYEDWKRKIESSKDNRRGLDK